jgi:hypothetical protein
VPQKPAKVDILRISLWQKFRILNKHERGGLKIFLKTGVKACSILSSSCCCDSQQTEKMQCEIQIPELLPTHHASQVFYGAI